MELHGFLQCANKLLVTYLIKLIIIILGQEIKQTFLPENGPSYCTYYQTVPDSCMYLFDLLRYVVLQYDTVL